MNHYDGIFEEINELIRGFLENCEVQDRDKIDFAISKEGSISIFGQTHSISLLFWCPGEESWLCNAHGLPENSWRTTIQSVGLKAEEAYLLSDPDWMPRLVELIRKLSKPTAIFLSLSISKDASLS